jgi:AAA family ATP:ADP antiporter
MGFALASATLLVAQYVASKATRDALFLTHFPVTDLPKTIIGAALLAVAGVLLMSRLLVRFGPTRVVPAGLALSAAAFAAEWMFLPVYPQAAVALLYLHVSGTGAILISGFWSVINERFDPHAARRAIAKVAAAATLGGVLGGLIAQRVAALSETSMMLPLLALMNAGSALLVNNVSPQAPAGRLPASPQGSALGIRLFLRLRYLHLMALLGLLTAVAATLLDYALKSEAAARFTTGQELMEFFSLFYAVIGVATFATQTALGGRVLERFGLGVTIAVQPVLVIATGLLAVIATKLWTVVLARASEFVLVNSFYRSSFELLYTPLPPEEKRATKTLVDVGAQRTGDMVGSGLLLLLLLFLPGLDSATVVLAAVAVCVAMLLLVYRLRRGYVEQLAHSLRDGVVSLQDVDIVDATTRMTLSSSGIAVDREQMLAETGQRAPQPAGDAPAADGANGDPLVRATKVLSESKPGPIAALLAEEPLDLRLVPQVIPLLAREELRPDAQRALRGVATRIVGQVADAFLDPATPLRVRRWLPGLLESSGSQRAFDGLVGGLNDPHFEVRYRCARALARMVASSTALRLDRDAVCAAAERELDMDISTWEEQSRRLESAVGRRNEAAPESGPDLSLQYVFTLLGLAFDQQDVAMAFSALQSHDRALHGTALEYLENVLPESLREPLWGRLGVHPIQRRSPRPPRQVVDELLQSPGGSPLAHQKPGEKAPP